MTEQDTTVKDNGFLTITHILEFLKCAEWFGVAAILTPEEEVGKPMPEGCLFCSECEFGILINPITMKIVNEQTVMTVNVNDSIFLLHDKDVKQGLLEAGVSVENTSKKYHIGLQKYAHQGLVHYHECNLLSGGKCNCEQLDEQYANADGEDA